MAERKDENELYMLKDGKSSLAGVLENGFELVVEVERLRKSLPVQRECEEVQEVEKSSSKCAEDKQNCSMTDEMFRDEELLTVEYKEDVTKCFDQENKMKSEEYSDVLLHWHRKLGHSNYRMLAKMLKEMGIPIPKTAEMRKLVCCSSCSMVKQVRRTGKLVKIPRSLKLFEMIHCDICGPFNVKGLGNTAYYSLIVEDYSRIGSVMPLEKKTGVYEHLDKYIGEAMNMGYAIIRIRSDNGREYVYYAKRLKPGSHIWEYSPAYTQHANGVAERRFRLLNSMAICMLLDARLPDRFWPFAIVHANDLHALIPQENLGGLTPYELRYSKSPEHSYLKVFGCVAYRHLDKAQRAAGKWVIRATPCMHLGNARNSKTIYKLYDFVKEKVYEVSSVTFREDLQAWPNFGKPFIRSEKDIFDGYYEVVMKDEIDGAPEMLPNMPIIPMHMRVKNQPIPRLLAMDMNDALPTVTSPADDNSPITYSKYPDGSVNSPTGTHLGNSTPVLQNTLSNSSLPDDLNKGTPLQIMEIPELSTKERYQGYAHGAELLEHLKEMHKMKKKVEETYIAAVDMGHLRHAMALLAVDATQDLQIFNLPTCYVHSLEESAKTNAAIQEIPISFKQAKISPEFEDWLGAMRREMEAMFTNNTFVLEEAPPGIKPLYSKWVFAKKTTISGDILYKARWVAGGNDQVKGINFDETYAPTVNQTTLRSVLAIATIKGWEVRQFDVVTAFLNPLVDNDCIYVRAPQGIEEILPDRGDFTKSVRLVKALYGLKQSPRLWWQNVDKVIRELGLKRCDTDINCFYSKGVILLLYVDDILIFRCNSSGEAERVAEQLMATYKMKDLGPLKMFLGLEIIRNSTGMLITQTKYIQNLINEYGMSEAGIMNTPADLRVNLSNDDGIDSPLNEKRTKLYRSMIGSLLYASLGTRPDIAYATAAASRFSSAPRESHMTAVKRIIRYLKGTVTWGLFYNRDAQPLVSGFVDSDWATAADRRSIGGYCFGIGCSLVSWKSKRQPIIALSTVEAELISCSEGTREALWLGKLIHELSPVFASEDYMRMPVKIWCDNQGTIALVTRGDMNVSSRTKHIELRHFHARECQSAGLISLHWVETKGNIADMFTKPLDSFTFFTFCSSLSMAIKDEDGADSWKIVQPPSALKRKRLH